MSQQAEKAVRTSDARGKAEPRGHCSKPELTSGALQLPVTKQDDYAGLRGAYPGRHHAGEGLK